MRESYKVSEIAKIFNISRRTLIYYDEVGLFKPSYIDEENGYRYYSGHQIYILRFIIALKNSGFSLNEIKKYTSCENIEDSQRFLETKIEIMEEKMKSLENSIEVVRRKYDELERAKSSKGLEPGIIEDFNIRFAAVEVETPYRYMQVEKAFKKLTKIEKKMQIKEKKHITVVDRKNLKRLDVYPLKLVGSIVPDDRDNTVITIRKERCAGIIHKKSFESLKESYIKLLDFIEVNEYEITGDAFEISNEEKIQMKEGVGEVIEIYIPIK